VDVAELAEVEEDDDTGEDDAGLAEALSDVDDIMSSVFGDSDDTDTVDTAGTDGDEDSGAESDGEDADSDAYVPEDEEEEDDAGTQGGFTVLTATELADLQEESDEALAELLVALGSTGELLASGAVLTQEQSEELAEDIPGPVPYPFGALDTGVLDVRFSKPIAVPPHSDKKKLVKLVMENRMCEVGLRSAETGELIIGKPLFDEAKFIDKA
jgi:hypothetical protein